MKIVCAGMRRSASTWLYNATRVLVSTAIEGTLWAGFEDTWKRGDADHVVMKTHRFDVRYLFGADVVLTCHRDLRDVAASAVRRELCEADPVSVIEYLTKATRDEFDRWEEHADLVAPYSSIVDCPEGIVKQIAETIGAGSKTVQVVVDAVAALPIGDKVDPEILLHKNHFTNGGVGTWDGVLSHETVHAVDAVFGDWQRDRGYDR